MSETREIAKNHDITDIQAK